MILVDSQYSHDSQYSQDSQNSQDSQHRHEDSEKTGSYICHTCKTSMKRGKIPTTCIQNGFQLVNIEEGCHLTGLENNLIAQNIIFQYIFYLKKSRWAATKKQMVREGVNKNINYLGGMFHGRGGTPIHLNN